MKIMAYKFIYFIYGWYRIGSYLIKQIFLFSFINLELSSSKYAWLKIIINNLVPFSLNINSILTKKYILKYESYYTIDIQVKTNLYKYNYASINNDVLFETVQHPLTFLSHVYRINIRYTYTAI